MFCSWVALNFKSSEFSQLDRWLPMVFLPWAPLSVFSPEKPIEAVDESTKRLPRASSKSVLAAATNQKRDFKSGDSPSGAGGISTHFVKLSLILDLSRLFLSSFACIQKLCHYATDEIGGKYESSECWFSRRWINDEFQIGKMLRSDQFNQWCPRTFWSTDSPCR